jgi:hypothetical protein
MQDDNSIHDSSSAGTLGRAECDAGHAAIAALSVFEPCEARIPDNS